MILAICDQPTPGWCAHVYQKVQCALASRKENMDDYTHWHILRSMEYMIWRRAQRFRPLKLWYTYMICLNLKLALTLTLTQMNNLPFVPRPTWWSVSFTGDYLKRELWRYYMTSWVQQYSMDKMCCTVYSLPLPWGTSRGAHTRPLSVIYCVQSTAARGQQEKAHPSKSHDRRRLAAAAPSIPPYTAATPNSYAVGDNAVVGREGGFSRNNTGVPAKTAWERSVAGSTLHIAVQAKHSPQSLGPDPDPIPILPIASDIFCTCRILHVPR